MFGTRAQFKPKHVAMPAYKDSKPIELRCIKDGSLRLFFDDGPHDKPGATAHTGRAQVIQKIKHREESPVDGEPIAIFVWDKPTPPPRVWDKRVNEYVEPAVMSDRHRAAMEAFIARRNDVVNKVQEALDAKKREAEVAAEQGAMKLLAALGDKVAAVKSKGAARASID